MKQNAPKISVVMPVWNATKYLPQSIESILNQNFDDFELIIIDDGSTDRSVEIVNSYRNRDRNIVVYENPHNFINSLNTGIALSRGKYIVRMDADDIMLPDRLEVQFCFMEENPEIDVCGSWMEIFGANSHIVKAIQKHEDILSGMLFGNCMCHPTIIMRRVSVSKLPFFPNIYKQEFIYAEDYKLWTDLAMMGCQFANIPAITVKYRVSEGQNTNRFRKEMLEATLKIENEYAEFYAQKLAVNNDSLIGILNEMNALCNSGVINFSQFRHLLCVLPLD